MTLENRTIAITGAARGLGAALAIVAADRGMFPLLLGRNATALAEVAGVIESRTGYHAPAIVCDLADSASIAAAADEISATCPALDILVVPSRYPDPFGRVSVEAQVRHGPVTILGLTQTRDGRLKWLCAEGWSLPGEILHIGNTNSRLRFTPQPDDAFAVADWMNRWAAQGPTHHVALGIGHQAGTISKMARLLGLECVRL